MKRQTRCKVCGKRLNCISTDTNVDFWDSEKEPTQRWIPISERLPKENVKVLTQDNEGNIQVDWLLHLELRWFYSQHHIVAWQPLPKPYVPDTNVGKMEEIGI